MTALSNVQANTGSDPKATQKRVISILLNNSIFIALIVEVLIFIILGKEKFANSAVFAIILQNASVVGIIMPFYTAAMISGIVDFSTFQVGALAGTIFAVMVSAYQVPWWLSLLLAMILVTSVGALNSWVVIRLRIPSIVATLVGGGIASGAAFLLAEAYGNAYQVKAIAPLLRKVWEVKPLGAPLTVYIMFFLYVIIYIMLNHTKLGAHLYAVGANPEAAHRSGINIARLVIFMFLLLAFMTGLANIIFNVRVMNAGPYISPTSMSSGAGIPVTLVGALFAGIGLFGGTGRVEFTLVGLLFFSVLGIGMSVIGFPAQSRVAVDGIAIVLALVLDSIRRYMATR